MELILLIDLIRFFVSSITEEASNFLKIGVFFITHLLLKYNNVFIQKKLKYLLLGTRRDALYL